MKPDYSGDDGTSKDLAYDLRQRYAKLVADHLDAIATARFHNDFPRYFKLLKHLHTVVKHKIKEKKKQKTKKETKEKETKEDSFNNLVKEFVTVANKYTTSYQGKSQDAEGVSEVEDALLKIEMYLYKVMNDAGMFGSKRNIEGLK